MPLRKTRRKTKTHSSPLPSHHQTQSSPRWKKKKKIAQHRLASTNDLLFDEDGIIIAESDCWHRFNASLRSRIRSERSRGGKKSRGSCPTISNVTRNGEVTTPFPLLPTCPPRLVVARIHESVTLSLTKLAFTYASSIVRSVGLEVPRAFWNDVVGRGRFSPGRLEYDRHREACLPLYRPSPTAPLFSMADGQSYRPSTNSNFTRHTPNEGGRPFAWKSSSCGFDEPASPHENPPPIRTPPPPLASIIFVFYPLSRMIFRPYLSGRLEENSIRREQVWRDWKLFSEWIYLLVWFWKIFREAEREIFGEIKLKKNLYKLNYHCR